MILVELTAAVDGAGTLQTFYISTESFTTTPADTPPNVSFIPALIDPGDIGLHAYADGQTTGGATQLESGSMLIANADGEFDNWLTYSFDGRPVTIRTGAAGGAYPDDFTTIFVGTVESLDADWTQLTLLLRDKQYLFTLPAQINKYGGTNVLPAGVDGTPDDILGQSKPRVWGTVFQVPAVQVNTSKLVYQVNDGAVASIPAVYDMGAVLSLGVDFATSTLLLASVPTSGFYNTCKAQGYFMLGAVPAGTITADVVQGLPASRTVAQVLSALAVASGLDPLQISDDDVVALDTLNSAPVGMWLNDNTTTYQNVMDQVAASIGAWYGFDFSGILRMGILTVASGTPALSLGEYDFADTIIRRAALTNNIPVWSVTANYAKVWQTQTTSLATSTTPAFRAYVALANRTALVTDPAIQAQYLMAVAITLDGVLNNLSDATNEATRQLNLQKVHRDIFDVPISLELFAAYPVGMLDVIELTCSRFNLSSGKMFRLIGIRIALVSSQIILTIWG